MKQQFRHPSTYCPSPVKIEKPYQAAAALVSLGVAVPSLPQAWPAITALLNNQPVTTGALWLAVLVGSAIGALAFGLNGIKGRSDAEKLLQAIRERPTMPAC